MYSSNRQTSSAALAVNTVQSNGDARLHRVSANQHCMVLAGAHPSGASSPLHCNEVIGGDTSSHKEAVMEAAKAAEQVKHACTISEAELLGLRPTLLQGYASMKSQDR